MKPHPQTWHAVSVTVPKEYSDAAEHAFNELDALGTEIDLLTNKNGPNETVTAYFSLPPAERDVIEALSAAARLYGRPPFPDVSPRRSTIGEQDWLAEWKKHWIPVRVGRFTIAAPWHEMEEADEIVVRIEPNMAFGTGTHETTKLCLAVIDRYFESHHSLLDVGTGTGILAIAAAKAASPDSVIAAVEIDEEAVAIARQNAALNGVADRIDIRAGSADGADGKFDLVCANLTADVILSILPEILEKTRGRLILSGILAEQEEMVLAALPVNSAAEVTRDGEWIAISVSKG
jgi:ribosomal protein L11 methyltransferase